MQMLLMLSTAYFEFLPHHRKLSRLWIENEVNYVPTIAEIKLRDDLIQGIPPPMCFTFIFSSSVTLLEYYRNVLSL